MDRRRWASPSGAVGVDAAPATRRRPPSRATGVAAAAAAAGSTQDNRRVPFIYKLLKDKMTLTSKCAELCRYVEQVEAAAKRRFDKREKVLNEVADARFEQWKADFRARHQKEKKVREAAIRRECIEAFKPEVGLSARCLLFL